MFIPLKLILIKVLTHPHLSCRGPNPKRTETMFNGHSKQIFDAFYPNRIKSHHFRVAPCPTFLGKTERNAINLCIINLPYPNPSFSIFFNSSFQIHVNPSAFGTCERSDHLPGRDDGRLLWPSSCEFKGIEVEETITMVMEIVWRYIYLLNNIFPLPSGSQT